ncbi:aspartate-semialdehyde dehydrogenase [Candidatus Sumerlaeota bacterium]|nr:aspartate-semialdehyde dehydrogenase [Candidatus Sumerlaeota bacterium]
MLRLAVMGATGAVGQEMLNILEQRKFQYDSLKLLASARSAGKKITVSGREYAVEELTDASFDDVDIVLASAGASVSKRFVPAILKAGATIVDNTSAFRMEPHIPLVVPEVNPDACQGHPGIIANPNCSTIQMVVALAPIHRKAGIKRLVISTYQSTSGKGMKAMEELTIQSRQQLTTGGELKCEQFPHPIAFNCLPHIDSFLENGYTKEEMKMVNETRKILGDQSIMATATTVRVPVYRGHAECVNVEMINPISADEVREMLRHAPGVEVQDDPANCVYPLQRDCEGRDETFVGRIRQDISNPNAIDMWIVSDNLRKGAALNAVQIAELLIAKNWVKATPAATV